MKRKTRVVTPIPVKSCAEKARGLIESAFPIRSPLRFVLVDEIYVGENDGVRWMYVGKTWDQVVFHESEYHEPMRNHLPDAAFLFYLPSLLHQTLLKRSLNLCYTVIDWFGYDEAQIQDTLRLVRTLDHDQLIAVSTSLHCMAEIAVSKHGGLDKSGGRKLHKLALRVRKLADPRGDAPSSDQKEV